MRDYINFLVVVLLCGSFSFFLMELGMYYEWWSDFYLTGILINSFSFFAFITVMEILDWFKWNKISLEVKKANG
jgi:hypothetical protein